MPYFNLLPIFNNTMGRTNIQSSNQRVKTPYHIKTLIIPHTKYTFNNKYTKYDLKNIIPSETRLCLHRLFTMHINLDCIQSPRIQHILIYLIVYLRKISINQIQTHLRIYTAEVLAILIIIEYFSDIKHNYITIHSVSLSTLTSLQNLHYPTNITRKIQNAHYRA